MPDLKVVELFCGIGGFHQALIKVNKELKGYPTELEFRLLSAMDINNNATSVYKLNHLKSEQCCRNGDINNAPWERTTGYNTLVMSPPCQPFSRNGNQKDAEDSRTKPLLSIIDKLKTMKKKHLPRYIVLENVKFFERSETCKMLLTALKERGFIFRQFLISPTDLGVPNQRARYFLIAKRGKNMKFHFDSYVKNWKRKKVEPEKKKPKLDPMTESEIKLPTEAGINANEESESDEESINEKLAESEPAKNEHLVKMYPDMDIFVREDGDTAEDQILGLKTKERIHSLERYIQDLDFEDDLWKEIYQLGDQLQRRFINVVDIVRVSSHRSICFTKAYGKYAQGTGSMIDMMEKEDLSDKSRERLPENYRLRYFTEMEVAGLMGFPKDFSFPPELTTRQRYAMLGNSLNVDVAAMMIKLMVLGDDETKLSAQELEEFNKLKATFQ